MLVVVVSANFYLVVVVVVVVAVSVVVYVDTVGRRILASLSWHRIFRLTRSIAGARAHMSGRGMGVSQGGLNPLFGKLT